MMSFFLYMCLVFCVKIDQWSYLPPGVSLSFQFEMEPLEYVKCKWADLCLDSIQSMQR